MINKTLRKLVRGDVKWNPANFFRNKRSKFFISLLGKNADKNLRVLDIGGTDYFWETIEINHRKHWKITLLNSEKIDRQNDDFKYLLGDALDLSNLCFDDYDLIFSNSVIEHVGGMDEQRQFANQILFLNKPFFIQTPNYYFPFEPHFLFLGFQFLPIKFRAWLIRHFDLGWYKKELDYKKSLLLASSIHLLKFKELQSLFPKCNIYKEKFLFMTKSFVVYRGF